MDTLYVLVLIFAAIIVSAAVSWLLLKSVSQKKISSLLQEFSEKEITLNQQRNDAEKKGLVWEERFSLLKSESEQWKTDLNRFRDDNSILNGRLEKAKAEFLNMNEKLQAQKTEMEELQKKLTTEFENIANRIMRRNSEEFTAANQKNLGEVLNPLKEKILLFEKKVEDTYQKGLKDQTDLKAELKKLHELNSKISEEAHNLTKALKGDVKKQGNWGEVVLERILERSGLNEGPQGYQKQFSDNTEEGRRVQPDIVINLPDNKHIIIDSKVSLLAYERAVNAQEDHERLAHLKDHLASLKAHIKGLSDKHYQSSANLNTPDFVLLFIPIEASFSQAVQEDHEIFMYAWDLKVVLVSPSTLLATLRTIASIWQQENQNRNALEIARQGGALYDKFVGFIADMEKIGNNLKQTQGFYNDAMNKLSTGTGNLVTRAENIRKLGAKATKEIPSKFGSE